MMLSRIQNQLNSVTSYLLVFLFTYTALSKIIDHETFKSAILQSPLIKNEATAISWLIPGLEILIVIMLLSYRLRNVGLLMSLLLMTMFTGYIVYMILFVPHLPCSCGGVIQQLSWSNHVWFNCVFIILITTVLFSSNKHKLFIAINRTSRKPV